MKKLKAAVIGVGYLGNFHAQKYKNNSHVELVGVFDKNIEQAEKIAKNLEVKAFNSLEAMVGKIDLATVACSTKAHFEVAEFLIKNKIHVNVEKPITESLDTAERLIKMAVDNNVKLSVGHIERFNPAFVKWRSMTGTPLSLEFERSGPYKSRGADVSVVHDLMIHDLDLLLSLKPGPVRSIDAQGARVLSNTVDWAVAWISFSSGMRAFLKSSRVSPIGTRLLKSVDRKGSWTVNLGNGEIDRVNFEGKQDSLFEVEKIATEKVDGLQKETDAFVDSVSKDLPPLISGTDGLEALELVERICQELKHV